MNIMTKIGKAQAKSGVSFERTTITPELAEAFLDKNTSNRKLSAATVKKYTADMRAGLWEFTGDPIRFDQDGTLIDGQHRLAACIKAQKPFDAVIIYNMPSTTKDVLDGGRRRSAADVLSIHGHSSSSVIATMVRCVLMEAMDWHHGGITLSTPMTLAILDRHPRLPLHAHANSSFPKGISGGAVSFICYVGSVIQKRPERVAAMLSVLRTGVPDYPGCAMHAYRERMLRIASQEDGSYHFRDRLNALRYAWNAFIDQNPISHFRIPKQAVPIEGVSPSQLIPKRLIDSLTTSDE